MPRLGGITRGSNFVVKAWFGTMSDEKLQHARDLAARHAVQAIIKKAKLLAAKPSSPIAKGTDSGKLVSSIKFREYETSKTGATTRLVVFVDQAMTPTDNGTSYAIYQERGTGLYGSHRREIRSASGKFMVWLQRGAVYRGRYVEAKKIGMVTTIHKGGMGRGDKKWQKREKVSLQVAWKVKGARPKHFWRDATQDPAIKTELKARLAKLIPVAIKSDIVQKA